MSDAVAKDLTTGQEMGTLECCSLEMSLGFFDISRCALSDRGEAAADLGLEAAGEGDSRAEPVTPARAMSCRADGCQDEAQGIEQMSYSVTD